MGNPIRLPNALLSQYDKVNYKCFMGVFPEINRAWLTRDNHFFLWNYAEGASADFVAYDDLDQVIISAGLVRPKAGVFRDEIQWLLVLATPVEIVIVGMSFTSGSILGELTLIPTPLTIPSDNVNIISIQGTMNGRIFLTGRDGNLYELAYQQQDGWFTRKCRKLNHSQSPIVPYVPSFLRLWQTLPIIDVAIDHSRNILYTLSAPVDTPSSGSSGSSSAASSSSMGGTDAGSSSRSRAGGRRGKAGKGLTSKGRSKLKSARAKAVITVWDLGESCTEMIRVRTYNSVLADARRKNRSLRDNDPIVAIHAIPVTEFRDIHLLAVTKTGIRIYMTTFHYRGSRPQVTRRPKTLQVVQVRAPPPVSASPGPPVGPHGTGPRSALPDPYSSPLRRGGRSNAFYNGGAGPSDRNHSAYGAGVGGGEYELAPPAPVAGEPLSLNDVHASHYSHGVYIMADASQAESECVVGVVDAWRKVDHRMNIQSRHEFTNSEKSSVLAVEGTTWAVQEVPMSIMIQLDRISELAASYAYLTQDARSSLTDDAGSSTSGSTSNARKRRAREDARGTASSSSSLLRSSSARSRTRSGGAGRENGSGDASFLDLPKMFWSLFGGEPEMPATYVPLQSRPNELATQHILPARKFLVLTSYGINVLIKLRPVDVLRKLLLEVGDSPSPRLVHFFEHYGAGEACAMCLILATTNPHDARRGSGSSALAARAIAPYMDAGSPTRGRTDLAVSGMGGRRMRGNPLLGGHDGNVVMYATSAFFNFSGFASFPNDADLGALAGNAPGSGMGRAMAPSSISYSGAHDGLYLYFSRLVKPVWEVPLTYKGSSNSNHQFLQLEHGQYMELEEALVSLKTFLMNEPRFAMLGDPETFLRRSLRDPGMTNEQRKVQAHAQERERESLRRFQALLDRTIEGVAFLKVLLNYNFSSLTLAISSELATRVSVLNFRELVSTPEGDDVSRELVMELMRMVAGDDTTEEISNALHNSCPSFFSYGDMLRYKGFEALYKAEQAPSARIRNELLGDALKHFVQSAATLDHLTSVTDRFRFLRAYNGVLELSLARAHAIDPEEAALQWVLSGAGAAESVEGLPLQGILESRFEAYGAILDALGELLRPPAPSGGGGNAAGLGLAPRPDFEPGEMDRIRAQFVQRAVASRDELFHIELYRWYIREDLLSELLSISSPYLESFLKREDDYVDMLCTYYVRNSKFREAATILSKLAEKVPTPGVPGFPLTQRIQYLVRAIKCASAEAANFVDGEFLHELEEKLEVAQLQAQILHELEVTAGRNAYPRDVVGGALAALDSQLLNITELYNEFAEPFLLYESQLAVLHTASGLDDRERELRVREAWDALIKEKLDQYEYNAALNLQRFVVTQGLKFPQPTPVFRLDFLASCLEANALEFDAVNPLGWVVDAFVEAGFSPETVFGVYNRLFDQKLAPWQEQRYQVHLLSAILYLIGKYELGGRGVEDARVKYRAALGAIPGGEAEELRQRM